MGGYPVSGPFEQYSERKREPVITGRVTAHLARVWKCSSDIPSDTDMPVYIVEGVWAHWAWILEGLA